MLFRKYKDAQKRFFLAILLSKIGLGIVVSYPKSSILSFQ